MTLKRESDDDASWCQVRLPSGRQILLRSIDTNRQAPALDSDEGTVEDVRFRSFDFVAITTILLEVGDIVRSAVRPLAPYHASVELGLGLSARTGEVVALFGTAAADASLKVTLDWKFGEKDERGDED